ncbi:SPOR domain-containing protein [Sediminicola luteus]|uniref:SPOR domain-containing protein n=1 Tax=Sediminicola luteus TaxID=319238 RepID=A0A2A4G5F6_9FLAO|nr:SPOR domain-containing protein [Sediminicola luteus]PCE63220.1 hypothetical protein B7P33_13405 [Sediminicola luteus]
MKKPLLSIVYCAICLGGLQLAHGQEATTEIEQDPKIDRLLELYTESNKEKGYYRIQIFSGTHAASQKAKEEARVEFPDWSVKITFDQPNYKVKIGRFNTKLEAERQLIEVRKKFPGALLPATKTKD